MATRDFPIEVTRESEVMWEGVRALVTDILEIQLHGRFDVIFLSFDPQMAPPFPTDTAEWNEFEEWETPTDARLGLFYGADFVVTPYDPLAGQEVRFPSWDPGRSRGVGGHNPRWEPKDGVVFYTPTEQYKILTADLEQFVETHSGQNREEKALDLQGRPVIDFLVERLQTSRLVPDETLYWLGLERTPAARRIT